MNNTDADKMIKSLNTIRKQASNLINGVLTPELMSSLNDEQLKQVNQVKSDLNALNSKSLTKDSEIFKKYN